MYDVNSLAYLKYLIRNTDDVQEIKGIIEELFESLYDTDTLAHLQYLIRNIDDVKEIKDLIEELLEQAVLSRSARDYY